MSTFASGNKVRVLRDRQLVQNLQQGHGGWNDSMAGVRRKGENRFSSKLPFDSQTRKTIFVVKEEAIPCKQQQQMRAKACGGESLFKLIVNAYLLALFLSRPWERKE